MDREWLSSHKTLKSVAVVFLVLASLLILVKTVGAFRGESHQGSLADRPQISVTGTADVTALPDVAEFTFTVQEEGKTTKDAQEKATAKTNKALAFLKDSKIAEKDIKTIGYNVGPKYEYQTRVCITAPCAPGAQVLVGYEVSQTIQVKVRDTTQSGTIFSGIGNLNVNNVSGLNFTIDDEANLKRDARKQAIEDAQAKAKALSSDLNVHLGKIISFQENTNGGPIYYGKAMLQSQDSASGSVANPVPSIPTGENTITSNVTIVYEIR